MNNTAIPEPENKNIRRRKVIFLNERYVLNYFQHAFRGSRFINVPEPLGLPKAAKLICVHHDWQRNSFAFVVEDESFEEVEDGVSLPEIRVEWRTWEVEVKPEP